MLKASPIGEAFLFDIKGLHIITENATILMPHKFIVLSFGG